jgi:hypothetical protein
MKGSMLISEGRVLTATIFAAGVAAYAQPAAQNIPQQPGRPEGPAAAVRPVEGTTNAPGPGYDPLAFYRKNPELMRRYFPHLFQQGAPAADFAAAPMQRGMGGPAPGPALITHIWFEGGSAKDFAAQLKKNAHIAQSLNIMISPQAEDLQIPAFELNNVTLPDLFQALNNLSEDKTAQWQLTGSTEPIWVLSTTARENTFAQRLAEVQAAAPPPKAEPKVSLILPVGQYLSKYKLEDITTAVRTAWGMLGDETGAEMKYHKDTDLLIAVGTRNQLSVLQQVLGSLERASISSPERTSKDQTKDQPNEAPRSDTVEKKF